MDSQPPRCVTNVAVCTVNNWALDFDGNAKRILKTCEEAHRLGAKVRLGPELEIPSYGCEDHFLEEDTEAHSWAVLRLIAAKSEEELKGLLIVTGMPVRYKGFLYNCMVSVVNGLVVFIYPKSVLCNDDVYRESRWFVPWQRKNEVVDFSIPIGHGFKQTSTKFGSGYMESADHVKIGFEMCEEMWAAKSPSDELALQGVDIFCNASGSHHVLGKSCLRINQRVLGTTSKLGGVYLYANHRGCDGCRVYYDGMSSIAQNEHLYAQVNQFDLEDTVTVNALLDLRRSRNYRSKISSLCLQSTTVGDIPVVAFPARLLESEIRLEPLSQPITRRQRSDVEELAHGPPAFLWHYLRRSGASGYFLPLSGGQDSSSVALMVRLMCEKVCEAVRNNPDGDDPAYYLQGAKVGTKPDELCSRILYTCYMGSENSSEMTKAAAAGLAEDISSNHSSIAIDSAVSALLSIFSGSFDQLQLSFTSSDNREIMALQNIQARTRLRMTVGMGLSGKEMVLSYLYAQASLIHYKRPGGLLVLGSANVDESLVGYLTKYDCSSADINPIGSISKHHLRQFLHYVHETHPYFSHMKEVVNAVPTAELRPLKNGQIAQTDEEEIGLTYDELSVIGRLRRPGSCGPYSMFMELAGMWRPKYSYEEIADKVELFFTRYARNRHKATVSTPAYHANSYSNDDHRNDHRPFLYPDFSLQFRQIRSAAKRLNAEEKK